jgi:hypothetical protein
MDARRKCCATDVLEGPALARRCDDAWECAEESEFRREDAADDFRRAANLLL